MTRRATKAQLRARAAFVARFARKGKAPRRRVARTPRLDRASDAVLGTRRVGRTLIRVLRIGGARFLDAETAGRGVSFRTRLRPHVTVSEALRASETLEGASRVSFLEG